jgi:uncharacterized protein (DUF2062 family)
VPDPGAQKPSRRALGGLVGLVRQLWLKARSERSSPRGIGLSVAAGVFAGCTPWGVHTVVALGLATLLRLNRLWALLASRASFLPVYLLVAFCEIEVGHRLRTGQPTHLSAADTFAHRYEFITDWAVGTLLVGCALAAAAGLVSYVCARVWARRPEESGPSSDARDAAVSWRRLDGPRPPSSGSPTSAPPDPTP